MNFLRQSSGTGAGSGPTISIGPALDSTGAEYTGLVIGDLTLTKNGTSAAMAANATLTHTSNGHYDLVMIGNNVDTVGRLKIRCNKSGYQIPIEKFDVVEEVVYDALFASGATAAMALTTAERTAIADAVDLEELTVGGFSSTALSQLAGIRVSVGPQVWRGQSMELVIGDEYTDAVGRAITWELTGADALVDLTGASVAIYLEARDTITSGSSNYEITQATGATRTGWVDLTAADWADAASKAGKGTCQVEITTVDDEVLTIVGDLNLIARTNPA